MFFQVSPQLFWHQCFFLGQPPNDPLKLQVILLPQNRSKTTAGSGDMWQKPLLIDLAKVFLESAAGLKFWLAGCFFSLKRSQKYGTSAIAESGWL